MTEEKPESKGNLSKRDDESLEQFLEDVPTEFAEAIKELPEKQRMVVSGLFARFSSGPTDSPIVKHINSEHISQIISATERDSEREYRQFLATETTRRWAMGSVIAVIVIVLGYAGLTKDKDLSEKVINVGLGALGGGGIAFAVSKQRRD